MHDVKSVDIATKDELPSSIILIHRYLITKNEVVDLISTMLSLSNKEREDARVEQAFNKIKDDVFNDKWT